MLGLGWSEMLVIAVVVLIVVGPKDLPVMLRNLGRMMGSVRRMSNDFRREIDRAIAVDEIKEAKKALSDPLKQTTADITKEFNSIRDGKVEPSGKIKPGTEGQESVYEEIRAQAGMGGEKAAAPSAASASIRAKIAEQQAQKANTTPVEDKPVPVKAAAKPRAVAASRTAASKTASGKAKPARAAAKPTGSAVSAKSSSKSGATPKKVSASASKTAKAPAEATSTPPKTDAASRSKSAKAKSASRAEPKPAKAKP